MVPSPAPPSPPPTDAARATSLTAPAWAPPDTPAPTSGPPARRPRAGLPLRLRLALLSATFLGLTLLVFSLVVYFTEQRLLVQEVDRALVDRAQVIAHSITLSGSPVSATITVELPDTDALAFSGTLVQVVDMEGVVRSRTDVLRRLNLSLPVPPEAIGAAQQSKSWFGLVQLAGVPFRFYSQPLTLAGTPIGLILVARWIGPIQDSLNRLRLVLGAGTVVSVVLTTILSLLVARGALRPIDRLTRETEQIGQSRDFSRRVTAQGAEEVARLAATFNEMLSQLQEAFAAVTSSNNRLQAALESQRRFVADASHELRTPLTTVRGNASLLERYDTLTPEDRQDVVAQIVAESDRMSRLVSDLLTLARADAGQTLRREPVALSPLVQAVAAQGRTLAAGKVAVNVVRVADALVLGDPDALRQLLLVLVDNAIKYTPAGGSVSLSLHVESLRGQEKLARISVIDTGVGIAPDDLPHIFDRFYRADRARQTGGTGLGLAIGRWIAETHGGRIEVESEQGTGSIFTVILPVTAPVAAPLTAPPTAPLTAPPTAKEPRPNNGSYKGLTPR